MMRITIRIILIASFVLSIAVIIAAFIFQNFPNQAVWATIAAALAVITSIFSAWTAQRVLEIEEDSRRPYPHPSFDVTSRFGIVQLRVKNYGGSAAHDIKLIWDKPLYNLRGEQIKFSGSTEHADIPVLLPKESVAVLLDSKTSLFGEDSDYELTYTGKIEYKDASSRSARHPFFISLENHRHSLVYDSEEPRTHRELQKIPEELKKIREQLDRLT